MSKLHKKMVALGDMSNHSLDSVTAACGQPSETKPCQFSDIGEGTRATWTDGLFSITFNFEPDGKYCGIYRHRNWEPYVWLTTITVLIIAAALIIGAQMRSRAAELNYPADFETVVLASEGETEYYL